MACTCCGGSLAPSIRGGCCALAASGKGLVQEQKITNDRRAFQTNNNKCGKGKDKYDKKFDEKPCKPQHSHLEDSIMALEKKNKTVKDKIATRSASKSDDVALRNAQYQAMIEKVCYKKVEKEQAMIVLKHKHYKEKFNLHTEAETVCRREDQPHQKDMLQMMLNLIQAVKDVPGVDNKVISTLLANILTAGPANHLALSMPSIPASPTTLASATLFDTNLPQGSLVEMMMRTCPSIITMCSFDESF
ncbi:hypothetical protein SERLA73DRAFT_156507 [Serpula lacrymans var. lacrymans S7.3]|uniref:Uncharacterized protein n=1 Tax=Serpula lacrymans var. lacrymans (strain S7.3) TaxID=936435 RepID=F8QES3_SERL3|nr:hypothetical protein SERLA73DRAFT_156507 [Serpula lacrymans var. lacrymans S7.3]